MSWVPGGGTLTRWRDYRARQIELLAQSNQPVVVADPPQGAREPDHRTVAVRSPFSAGFLAALGVLTAWLLWQSLSQLTSVITFLASALFLTLVLNPIVELLTRRGMSRAAGVAVVFVGLLGVFTHSSRGEDGPNAVVASAGKGSAPARRAPTS